MELIDRQQGEITKLHDDYKTEVGALNQELRETSNTATMFQTENRSLKEQLKLLQPPPRRRRWYYGWLRAT